MRPIFVVRRNCLPLLLYLYIYIDHCLYFLLSTQKQCTLRDCAQQHCYLFPKNPWGGFEPGSSFKALSSSFLQAAVLTQNGVGGKYGQSASRQRRGGSHRHSGASRATTATSAAASSAVRRTQSAFVSSTNSDMTENFSGKVVDRDDDCDDCDDKSSVAVPEKKVVIKLEDSDAEENRGMKISRLIPPGHSDSF
jgi:hypothetical protein